MTTGPTTAPALERRFGLLQATALNMSNMIGIGPFITIPLLMSALGGPQALLGWLVALVIVMADGLVWSELSAAMPGSGGSYRYLREGFGRERWGRINEGVRAALVKYYGAEAGGKVQHAEAFEICEYGRRPDAAEVKRLFPFLPR